MASNHWVSTGNGYDSHRRIFSPALFYNLTFMPCWQIFSLCKQEFCTLGVCKIWSQLHRFIGFLKFKGPGCVCLHFAFLLFQWCNASAPLRRNSLRDFSESLAVNFKTVFLENCQQLWFGSCNLLYVNVQNIYGKVDNADASHSKKCFKENFIIHFL